MIKRINPFVSKSIVFLTCLFLPSFVFAQKPEGENNCIIPTNSFIDWIIPANTIDSLYSFCIIPNDGVFLFSKGECINPFRETTNFISFPKEYNINEIIWISSDECIFSSSTSLVFCNVTTGEYTILMTTDKSDIHFCLGKSGVLYYHEGNNILYKLSYKDFQTSILYEFNSIIHDIKSDGDNCFIAYENKIAKLSEENLLIPIINIKENINTLEIGYDEMVFFGTDRFLYFYDNNATIPIIKNGVKDILINSDSLYVIFNDNSAAVISHFSDYHSLSESLKSYIIKHPTTSKGFLLHLLNEESSSNFKEMNFGIFPFHGLYGVINNTIVGMDISRNSKIEKIALSDTINIDEFVFLRNGPIFKSGNKLLTFDKELRLHKRSFDTDAFSIEMHTDTTLLLYYEGNVFEYNPAADKINRLICLGNERIIECLYSNNENFFVVTEEYVIMKKEGKFHSLAKLSEKIVAADISPQGFFIGTENGLYELTENGDLIQLLETPISQILDDWEVTYVITQNGEIFYLTSSSPS